MRSKSGILTVFIILTAAISFVRAQNLTIRSSDGQIESTPLNQIQKLLFNEGELVKEIKTGPNSYTEIPGIRKITFNMDPPLKRLNVFVLPEGLYAGGGSLSQAQGSHGPQFREGIADQISVELRDSENYTNTVYASSSVNLGTNGTAVLFFPSEISGYCYLSVKHRNSITVVSADAVEFGGPVVSYAFDAANKAYGSNLIDMNDGYFATYGGDANQDGIIDTSDMTPIDNDSGAYSAGYLNTDINGDGITDTSDMTIVDNNSNNYIQVAHP